MKFTRKTKETFKKVLALVLSFTAVIGCVALIANFTGADKDGYKTVNPTFSVGGLSELTGRPTENECALYTKELIVCTGIKLSADFDSDIKYVLHLYDEDDKWISCIENDGLNMTQEELDTMEPAVYGVRIAIYPENDADEKISLFERATYANQLTVKITTVETKVEEPDAE